jgi:7-cyano-7-deazaguanine synthase
MSQRHPAVLLLSGGLDSTTLLAHALHDGFDVHAMTFRYGQRHASEIDAARRVAALYSVRDHVIVDIDLRTFGGSALTSAGIDVPKDRDVSESAGGIPITYVPARNTIFLSFALAWAEVLGARDIFIGVNALDYSGYPDCRPSYSAPTAIASSSLLGSPATPAARDMRSPSPAGWSRPAPAEP